MAKRIDVEIIKAMDTTGLSRKKIADVTGYSTRQLNRILGPVKDRKLSAIIESAEEQLREFYKEFETGTSAGNRFGISRQAILK